MTIIEKPSELPEMSKLFEKYKSYPELKILLNLYNNEKPEKIKCVQFIVEKLALSGEQLKSFIIQIKNDELITEPVEQDVASGEVCERLKFTKKGINLIKDLLPPIITANQTRIILQYLCQQHKNRAVTYKELINLLWDDDESDKLYSRLDNKIRFLKEYCLISTQSIDYEHLTDPRKLVSLSKVGVLLTDHFLASWFSEDEQPLFLRLRELRDLAPAVRYEVHDRVLEIINEYLEK